VFVAVAAAYHWFGDFFFRQGAEGFHHYAAEQSEAPPDPRFEDHIGAGVGL